MAEVQVLDKYKNCLKNEFFNSDLNAPNQVILDLHILHQKLIRIIMFASIPPTLAAASITTFGFSKS